VKGNLEALRALGELHRRRPQVRAVFLGPPLDPVYTERFRAALAQASFARWIPGVPPERMAAAYRAADAVLSTSRAEGLANVLLEAAAAGVPALASDIPANRGVVDSHGEPPGGLLYDPTEEEDFLRQALRLVEEPALRAELSRGGLRRAREWPTPLQEAEALTAVYRRALSG
jgi:glycosyltransferase involved in cell wall biosynthesis